MGESAYVWLMRATVAVYAAGGIAGLCAGRWRQGTLALLFAVCNALIFW